MPCGVLSMARVVAGNAIHVIGKENCTFLDKNGIVGETRVRERTSYVYVRALRQTDAGSCGQVFRHARPYDVNDAHVRIPEKNVNEHASV